MTLTNKQKDAFLDALGYVIPPAPAGAERRLKRRQARETFTALLSCKPIDVELRRLKYEALRKRKAKR